MTIIVPPTPEIGRTDDLKAAQKAALAYCRENFIGKVYRNTGSDDLIGVAAGGIKHSLHGAKPTLIRLMYALPEVIEGAAKVGSVPDKRGRPDFAAIHKYEADVQDGDRPLLALLVVREDNQGVKHFYDLAFLKR